MSTIVNRVSKGTKLTFAEVDANFSNLNTDKAEMTHSDTPPSSPTVGDFWFDTSTLTTYVYYNSQWVQSVVASGGNAGGSGISLGSLSVGAEGTASGDGSVTYNNSTGVFTYTPPVISGSSTTVVSSSANLPTSPSNGDLAFAVDTSRLYLSRNNAWYSVALVNTAPSVSGNQATYELATDGTATVVTMSATDPEGDPITWSHTASGLGSIATISRSNNVFTITPNTSNVAGTFSVSFQASDGANTANATSSFTLTFASPMTRGTQLLTKTSGNNNRTNSVFDDSSTSNHTITPNGDVYQTSFSPYSVPQGFWSSNFAAKSDQLNFTSVDLGTGNFTIEAWVKPDNLTGYHAMIAHDNTSNSYFQFHMHGANIQFWEASQLTATGVMVANEWQHVALTKDTSTSTPTFTIYHNGKNVAQATNGTSVRHINRIANYSAGNNSEGYQGKMSNVRLSNTLRYQGDYFTPPSQFTSDSNTLLLACASNRFIDNSSNAVALTATTGSSISTDIPSWVLPDVWKATVNGSAYLDGSGDSLSIASTTDLAFGTAEFTISFWLNIVSQATTYSSILDWRHSSQTDASAISISFDSSKLYVYNAGYLINNLPRNLNQWQHIVFQRRNIGGTLTNEFFINGVSVHSAANSTNWTASTLKIGSSTWNDHANFYISDLKINKANAVYSSAFTPPTSPSALDASTILKLNFTDVGIFDSAARSSIKLIGNTKESTTQTKYGTTSFYLDGSGDYVNITGLYPPRVGDFQLEGWFYETSSGDNGLFQAFAPLSNSTGGVAIGTVGATMWYQQANSQTNIGSHWGQNAWKHLAVVRRNGVQHLFVDGTRIDVRANTTDLTDGQINLGGYYSTGNLTTAYYEDFRYLKGHTTYPNEAPQIPLTAVSGTSLQLANASTIPSSPNGLTLTASEGSPTVSTFTPSYSTVTHSIYYDGNDITKIDANTALNFGVTDFTIEGHFYLVANVSTYNALFDNRVTNNNQGFSLSTNGTNMYLYSAAYIVNNIPFSFGKWHHIVYQRKTVSGTPTHQIYVDGMFIGESTTARTYGNNPFYIGGAMGTSENHNMYVSDFRIVKGSAVYDKSFTPPTGAL